jgi:simple sugar transport system permease protein
VLIGGTSIFGGRATLVGTVFGCFIIWMLEAGLVASGLTGAWVRTVQGLIFLIAIIFYLFVEEPARRASFFGRFRRPSHPVRPALARMPGSPPMPGSR